MSRWWIILLVIFAAGCAEVEKQPEPVVEPEIKAKSELPFKSDKLKYLANRRIAIQPTRPLNVRSRCSHRDAVGTTTKLDLQVKDAVVKSFDAQVAMKGYGACSFKLKDFEQTEKLPQALLKHKTEDGCSVRMWEQGAKVTVAFNACPKSCERDAFSYLWPIMIEAKSGRCF